MKNYELLYILPSTMTGEEISANFKEIIKNIEKLGGEMLETLVEHPFLIKSDASKEESSEDLKGLTVVKKKLAYTIEKNKFGFYCLINFSTEGEKIKEMDNYLKMNNNILRHIIVQEDPMTKEELARLHKLFARKRAEQEKEEKKIESAKEAPKEKREEIKAPEIKPTVEEVKPKKVVVEKEEKPKEEVVEEKVEKKETEEKKEKAKIVKKKAAVKAPEEKAVEEKPKAKKVVAEKEEKPKERVIEKEVEEEKEAEEKETPKKEESKKESSRKKKIKLEDLEDKLDEILEDTML